MEGSLKRDVTKVPIVRFYVTKGIVYNRTSESTTEVGSIIIFFIIRGRSGMGVENGARM